MIISDLKGAGRLFVGRVRLPFPVVSSFNGKLREPGNGSSYIFTVAREQISEFS